MRTRRLLAGLTLATGAAVVVVIVVVSGAGGTKGSAPERATGPGVATVRRRDLVQTDTQSGTLRYSRPQTVYNRLSGTITWVPGVGRLIRPGQPLFLVDNAPVILMDGSTPAYRDLAPSDPSGPDVLELNRNLSQLGFAADAIVVNDTWQAATTTGIELLQASLHEGQTGTLPLGQIVFLPGDQRVTTIEQGVGATTSGGGSPAAPAALIPVVASRPEFVSLEATSTTPTKPTTTPTTPTTTTPTTTTTTPAPRARKRHRRHRHRGGGPRTLAALLALLQDEVRQLQGQRAAAPKPSAASRSPARPASSRASSGGGSSGQPILQTTSTRLLVTVNLDASRQSEAAVGRRVRVQLPTGSSVDGHIIAVSEVAESSSSSGSGADSGGGGGGGSGSGSATVPVTIKLDARLRGAGLDQATVSVTFSQAGANNVLSVPVTALLATGGGHYAVQSASGTRALIPVSTGLFAAGYVQISGRGIHPGLRVTDAQG